VVTHRARGSVVLDVPPPRVILAGPGSEIRARLALPTDPGDGDVTVVVTHPGGVVTAGPAARTVVRVTGPEQDR
jgi:hypothetical protein